MITPLGENEYSIASNDGTEVTYVPFQTPLYKAMIQKCTVCDLPINTNCSYHSSLCPYSCNYVDPVPLSGEIGMLLTFAFIYGLIKFKKLKSKMLP